jgi:hypothetical protein
MAKTNGEKVVVSGWIPDREDPVFEERQKGFPLDYILAGIILAIVIFCLLNGITK